MRRKLVLAISGVAVVAVLLFAVPLALVVQRVHRDRELLRLQRDTVTATREVDISQRAHDPIEVPDPEVFAVYDTDAERVAGRAGSRVADAIVREALSAQAPVSRVERDRIIAAVPVVVEEEITGVVRGERYDAEASEDTRERWLTLGGVGLGVIGISVLAAVLLGRGLARPLERLAVAAGRLGEGDFAVRVERSGVPEVDEVAVALNTATTRLDELVSRERAFSADASHQLRTPLAALRIELEGLALRGQTSPELAAALQQVGRLQRTIDTLLALARDAAPVASRTAVRPVLEDAAQRWNPPLAAQGRRLAVELEDAEVLTGTPASVLTEILDVLLDNALRHGRGTVQIRAWRSGPSVEINVADDGVIAASPPERIFERRSPTAQGHGVGLALARSLAGAAGGRLVLARPAPATFTLLVPSAEAGE
jgi:signal transduction histidine kinase